MWAGTTEGERKRMIEFMGLVAVELDNFMPPETDPKNRRPKRFKTDPNPLNDPLYGIDGPTDEEIAAINLSDLKLFGM